MAITSAICNSFKTEILTATHDFTASTGDTFKLALYTSSATLDKSTTAYSATNETTNDAGSAYSAGGQNLTSSTPVLSTDTAVCDFANISWASATFTANGCLIYNSSKSNKAVCAIAFGGDKTATNGTFTIQFPTADASNAIIRIA
jgi:hypothetical protein